MFFIIDAKVSIRPYVQLNGVSGLVSQQEVRGFLTDRRRGVNSVSALGLSVHRFSMAEMAEVSQLTDLVHLKKKEENWKRRYSWGWGDGSLRGGEFVI